MDTRRLIDAIVRQTTVLIAQISTAAGLRSPLARVADQVFLELSRELEAQGVTRKVAADMFGLALRSYQKKVQRLAAGVTFGDRTLWGAVVEHLRRRRGSTRGALLEHFAREDAGDLAAVLKDLVDTGFVSCTGRGDARFYELTSAHAREAIAGEAELETITGLVWLAIYDQKQVEREALIASLPFGPALSGQAVAALLEDGRIERSVDVASGRELLRCARLVIPIGAERGWETAVFDHYRALATAIAAKLRSAARSQPDDRIGGSTLSFSVAPGHPFEAEVYGLLQRVRRDVNALWEQVTAHNAAQPVDPEQRVEVTFYFGQNVVGDRAAEDGEGDDEA